MLDLIDTKEFQRLRRIRQLGVASFVYPGAEHTRFVHSLGVFNYARRMIRKLQHKHQGQVEVCSALQDNSKTIKVAALLHDLGHGPLSHVFRALRTSGHTVRKHEEWTCKIIRDQSTEINQRLCREPGINIDSVCQLVSDKERLTVEPFLRDIVNSQLDADRMDYLLRDSMMTGSQYGKFDSEWILIALAIAEIRSGNERVRKLCLDASKGTGAIESMLFARRLMYNYVYGHKTTRAYEAELSQSLRLALELSDVLPEETPAPIRTLLLNRGGVETKDYLMLDDEVLWWALRRWAVWRDWPSGERATLGAALQYHSLRLVRRHQPWRMREIKGDKIIDFQKLSRHLERTRSALRFECFVDVLEDLPYKDFEGLRLARGVDSDDAFFKEIFLVDESGTPKRLAAAGGSPIIEGLQKHLAVSRFYYDPRFKEEFAGLFVEFGVS